MALLVFALCTLAAEHAHAHAEVDAGIAAAEEGLFKDALTHFERALGGGLSRAELVQLLSQRVLVRFALRQTKALEADLELLLALEPSADLGAMAPPELGEKIDAMRGQVEPIALEVRVHEMPGGMRVAVQTRGLDAHAFTTEVGMRSADSPWQTTEAAELRYPASAGVRVEYYALVKGPGGSVIASEGEPDAPRSHVISQSARDLEVTPRAVTDSAPKDDRDRRMWWWIAGGAAVAVAAIALGVGLAASHRDRQSNEVQAPMVVFP